MLPSLLPLPLRRLAWLAALGCASASAQNSLPELNALGSQWVQSAIGQGGAGGDEALQSLPLRMEVHVGKLDARLQLAPCNQVEPYLPAGSKLWGRTRDGLRCIEPGARPWNVFLPVTVQAWGMGAGCSIPMSMPVKPWMPAAPAKPKSIGRPTPRR